MPATERGRRPGIIILNGKSHPTSGEIYAAISALHTQKQEVEKLLTATTTKIEIQVKTEQPIRIIPISDIHLFTLETDYKKVEEMFRKLEDPSTYGLITGDFIEGANPRIAGHIGNVELPLDQQIQAGVSILKPWIATGKILGLTTGFDGHEGWGHKLMGLDIVQNMARQLKQPDGKDVLVLHNGDRLIIHLPNGLTHTTLIYHAPGGGGSDEINPVGAQRNRAIERSPGPTVSVDGVGGGDWHHRSASAKEIRYDRKSGEQKGMILYAAGTPKGNDLSTPDYFLEAMGKGPTRPPGVELIINQTPDVNPQGVNVTATYGYQRGEVVYEAARLLNLAERQRLTKELTETIVHRHKKPTAVFDRRNSRTRTLDDKSRTPLFETFKWKIDTRLPILVYLLANARYGSASSERDHQKLTDVLTDASQSRYKFVLAMRHFLDKGVANRMDRQDILDQVANDLATARDQNSLLGLMLSSSLRTGRWTREVTRRRHYYNRRKQKWVSELELRDGFYPGDYFYKKSAIKGTPLYLHNALMSLHVSGVEYLFSMLDHLSKSGSEFDPFRGLVQARRKELLAVDITAGGHMPGAGYLTTPEADYIATGWFADYDSGGKANQRRAALGGQGVILFPHQKMVVPASTFLEAKDLFAALTLGAGLTIKEKKKLTLKSR